MAISREDEKYQAGGAMDFTRPTRFQAPVNILDRVEFNAEVLGDNSQHFLEVVGTLPSTSSTSSGLSEGVSEAITSDGSHSDVPTAHAIRLLPGYSGPASTIVSYNENSVAGTSTVFSGGNSGVVGASIATTTGNNYGVQGQAWGGTVNYSVAGFSTVPKNSATNIGGAFFGRNTGTTPIEIGVYAGLHTTNPTFESAALVVDNAAVSAPIILARDNGTTVWSVQDGGSQQGKMGAKALTEGVPTAFVRISVPQGTTVGGFVKYAVEANDGVDFQIRTGILPFGAVNKAGAETGAVATVSTATETVAVSAGTLTMGVWTTASNAADTIDILADATSSLAQTTLRINYSVELYGNAIVTVTPL